MLKTITPTFQNVQCCTMDEQKAITNLKQLKSILAVKLRNNKNLKFLTGGDGKHRAIKWVVG